MARWYRQLWRQSRNFALVADVAVATLGGGMKTRQMLTGRMADALSELYLLSCVLKRFDDEGQPQADLMFVEMAMRNGLERFQNALSGAIDNFPNTAARWFLGLIVFPFGLPYRPGFRWAYTQGCTCGDGARRDAGSPDAGYLHLQGCRRSDRTSRRDACQSDRG